MRYTDVCFDAISYVLPSNIVTSDTIEKWLKPVYDRLHLPEGRLELMTGIKERRLWKQGTRPSEVGASAARKAMKLAGVSPDRIDCLLNCSVSRDFLEPATATAVHRLLGLSSHALNFDISNACLGALSGVVMLANMIQLGQVESGVIVSGEVAGPLIDGTVERMIKDKTLTRKSIKSQFASLTIGSSAAAIILTHRDISNSDRLLLGGISRCDTTHNHLCQGGMAGGGNMEMKTDAEELLERGLDVAEHTWSLTKDELGWGNDTPELICCHQVGRAHRDRLYQRLGLDPEKDFSTFDFLGNCGSASLPVTTAMALEKGRTSKGDRLALLGIGSGINCTMLGVQC